MQYLFLLLALIFLVAFGYQLATEPEKHCNQVTTGTINGDPVRLCTENR